MNRSILRIPQNPNICCSRLWYLCRSFANAISAESEYSDYPLYPAEQPVSNFEKWVNKRKEWAKKIERLPTVEQKLMELNMPKFYGYYCTLLNNETLKPQSFDFIKFVTRTSIIHQLPMQYYKNDKHVLDDVVKSIKSPIEDLICVHYEADHLRMNRKFKRPKLTNNQRRNENFIIDLNNLIMKNIKDHIHHLPTSSVDFRPRIEGFWFVGGFKLPNHTKKVLENWEDSEKFINYPTDRCMKGNIYPTLSLRSKFGLPEVVPLLSPDGMLQDLPEDRSLSEKDVDVSQPIIDDGFSLFNPGESDPMGWGLINKRKRAAIVPGFWPGEENEYGHIFFHSRHHLSLLWDKYGDYTEDVYTRMLQQNATVAGFTQALSFAMYQGFTTLNELTYPIVQQSVSTDGKNFQFAVYQLNTCSLHSHLSCSNERKNFLWLSEDLPLFDRVENSSVKGLNEEVLRLLCSFYLKQGEARQNSHPYLADYKYLMHHDAPAEHKEEFQKFLWEVLCDRKWKHNKPRPEITPWEKIYKIKFKTRHFDLKYKFFENRWAENPYTRRMDDYSLPYIPKVRRMNFKIAYKPRINSEQLFKHDWRTLKKASLFADDEIAFKTMNIRKDTPPYYNGLLWSRGMLARKTKL